MKFRKRFVSFPVLNLNVLKISMYRCFEELERLYLEYDATTKSRLKADVFSRNGIRSLQIKGFDKKVRNEEQVVEKGPK